MGSKAVIMAGGFGTRLRPLTMHLPKPMVPVMNRPMMEHIVCLLKKHGFTDLTSLLFYHPEVISNHFGDGSKFNIQMRYVKAEADFGTAGSVRNAVEEQQLKERFLVISGDVLTDFDLSAAIRFHEQKKAKATIVLTRVKNPLQFGVVMTDTDDRVTRFLEKPSWGEVFSDTINTGIYILEPEAYALIPYKKDYDFSKDLFPLLLQEPNALYGYIAEGYWRDIGNLQEYHEAHIDALNGSVKLELNGVVRGPMVVEEGAQVGEVIARGNNLIARGANVADGVSITNSVIGPDCTIESGATLESAVLWKGTRIGAKAHVHHAVMCANVSVGREAVINENVFIGERSQIGDRAEIMPNLKLWPEKRVEPDAKLLTSLVLEDRWTRALFTNSRISGLSNVEITPEFSAKAGASLGAMVGEGQTVVLSRDSDKGSRVISRAMTSGLMSAGVSVQDLQTSPIPLTRHNLRGGRQAAGVHIRKSPVDKRRSDIIFFDANGYDLSNAKGKAVERYFFGEDFPRAAYDTVGTIQFPAHTGEEYVERFTASLDTELIRRAHFRIAIDYAYGITSTIFPNILGTLGPEVVALNAYLEPSRLTRAREEFERSSKHLANVVSSLKYSMGFILDAGGERIGVVDENGLLYINNKLLTLVTKLFLESEKVRGRKIESIAIPISGSNEVEMIAKSYGVKVVHTKNTHDAMMHASGRDGIPFVGGTLGGFIFSDYFFAVDGMFTVAKMMEMLAVIGRSIGELAAELPRYNQIRKQVFCPTDQLGTVMRNAMEHSSKMKKLLVDGIKFFPDGSDSWVLILPDKERPYCDVIAEASDRAVAEALVDSYATHVSQWRGNGKTH